MKKLVLISLVLFLSSTASFSEIVSRILTYNGPGNQMDQCNAITQDLNGYVYATGVSWGGTSKEDYATIKFGENGDFLWVARYNGTGNHLDYASAIAVDMQGNVYVTGWSRNGVDFGTEDYVTIKYSPSGQQLWTARYNGTGDCYDFAKAIWVDYQGNVYITGISFGNNNAKDDYTTIKYSTTGQQLWVARYNGPSNKEDMAYSLFLDFSGNVYVTGTSFMDNKGYDMLTIKYNNAGTQQWNVRYNNNSFNKDDIASEVRVDNAGNVYITGSSSNASNKSDYTTIKYNSAGAQQWLKTFNGTANDTDVATGLDLDVYGIPYVTGYSKSTAGYDYYSVKYAPADGSVLWSNYYNGGSADKAWDIKVVTRSCIQSNNPIGDVPCWIIDIYVTGQSTGIGTSNDFLTVRYDEGGTQKWANRFNGPTNGNDAAYSISVSNNYPIMYAGGSFGSDYGIVGITEERPGDFNEGFSGLSTSYPNPFNPETNISFRVEKETNVKIVVYDVLGKTIAVLADAKYYPGTHTVNFNASNLNSGVYFYRYETDYAVETKKLVLVK